MNFSTQYNINVRTENREKVEIKIYTWPRLSEKDNAAGTNYFNYEYLYIMYLYKYVYSKSW